MFVYLKCCICVLNAINFCIVLYCIIVSDIEEFTFPCKKNEHFNYKYIKSLFFLDSYTIYVECSRGTYDIIRKRIGQHMYKTTMSLFYKTYRCKSR